MTYNAKEEVPLFPMENWVEQQQSTLYSDLFLEAAGTSDGTEAPQLVFGHFSRLAFHLINNGKRLDFNIPIRNIADIEKRSEYGIKKQIEYEIEHVEAEEAPLSPCYTVVFPAGHLKGKTPAQVMLENPKDGGEILNKQYVFLRDNLHKFEGNKKILEAITDAGKKFASGELDPTLSKKAGGKEFKIFESGPRPLRGRTRPDGKCFVYEVSIIWKVGAKQPVAVTVANYYAPVKQLGTGQLNVAKAEADKASFLKSTINVTEEGWMNFLKNVDLHMQAFASQYGPYLRKKADKLQTQATKAFKEDREEAEVAQVAVSVNNGTTAQTTAVS